MAVPFCLHDCESPARVANCACENMLMQFESLALQAGQRKQQEEQASAPLVDRPQDSDVPWNWQSELAQVTPTFCWKCVHNCAVSSLARGVH